MSTLRMFSFVALGLLLAPSVWAQTIPNPSFEANSFTTCPGYAAGNGGNITGWTISNVNGVGLNPSGCSAFADNGAIPNGANVAFVQTSASTGSITNTLSTTITGLTLGRSYTVSFRANCRANYPTPSPTWSLNGDPYVPFTASPAVGGSNPYYTNSGNFTATASTAALVIRNASTTNLTNWSPLGTASPRYFFTDTNAPAAPQRYYRLVYP